MNIDTDIGRVTTKTWVGVENYHVVIEHKDHYREEVFSRFDLIDYMEGKGIIIGDLETEVTFNSLALFVKDVKMYRNKVWC